MSLYYTLVLPYYNYCNIVWASGHTVLLEKLAVTQRKVLRCIYNLKWNANVDFIVRERKLLNIVEINFLQTACFMYKAATGLIQSLTNLFTPNILIHKHITRHVEDLHVLYRRTVIRADSIRIRGVKIWNNIDSTLRQAPTFLSFKRKTKRSIVDKLLSIT